MSAGYRLPSWAGPILANALLSGCMSLLVSGIATLRALGWTGGIASKWMAAWLVAWPIAFATATALGPLVRRIVAAIVEQPPHSVKPAEAQPRPGA